MKVGICILGSVLKLYAVLNRDNQHYFYLK